MRVESFNNLADSDIPVDWIVEKFISPGGWTFLVGEAKTGKSIWSIQLCEALQEGKPFLGMRTSQRDCLYVQADAGLLEWQVQVQCYAPSSKAWTAHQMKAGWLDQAEQRRRIHELIWGTYSEEAYSAREIEDLIQMRGGKPFNFVVFDCLHAITTRDINPPGNANKIVAELNQIVSLGEEKVPFLLIHHPNGQVTRGRTAGSGSKWFSGACTTKLTLGGDDEGTGGLLVLEGGKIVARREIPLNRARNGAWILPDYADDYDTAMQELLSDESDFTDTLLGA